MWASLSRLAVVSALVAVLIGMNAHADENADNSITESPTESVGGTNCMKTCLDDGEEFDICRESCVQITEATRPGLYLACR